MTANQRRPGFRLPWSSGADDDPPGEQNDDKATATTEAAPTDEAERAATNGSASAAPEQSGPGAADAKPAAGSTAPTENVVPEGSASPLASKPEAGTPASAAVAAETPAGAPSDFLRDLIAAMRKVADDARQSGITELKARADEAVSSIEAQAELRRQELRERADTDVSAVGEWARAEAERIKREAEQRVAARRAQLEEQLAADSSRTEAETRSIRARVDDYERELDAYHAQLTEIKDAAAFAAAAKRMPSPPKLGQDESASASMTSTSEPGVATTHAREEAGRRPAAATGEAPTAADVHPAEEEVLASRLAELDAALEAQPAAGTGPATTEIVVKGLGSFGAITGFRQSLAGQEGIVGVALSLGKTGEFVFRATHEPGFDMAGTIAKLEGDGATVEPRPEGGLHVTLERSR